MMTSSEMANYIISQIQNIDEPGKAINTFYKALCNYVEENMEILYAWVGVNPSGVSDPEIIINCKVKTSGSMIPSGEKENGSALTSFSGSLNLNASLWTIEWPGGFELTPAFLIPSITITPSGATDMNSAWLKVTDQIVEGLKIAATPSATGSHGAFIGTATFSKIL